MKTVNIYTDGACSGNQNEKNFGGYGAILEYGHNQKELFGGTPDTTNNRMEMTALLVALQSLKDAPLNLRIFSDSAYLLECFRKKWYIKWRANGWMRTKTDPVLNRDLWEDLLFFLEKHSFSFFLVKGHINLDHPKTDVNAHLEKFNIKNECTFSKDEFVAAVKMNNRADALANKGIALATSSERSPS